MDMLEFEVQSSPGALAARAESNQITIGTTTEILNRTFLIKKMEIQFSLLPWADTDITGVVQNFGYLYFYQSTGATDRDSLAEILDARLDDAEVKRMLIWLRNFVITPLIIDPTNNSYDPGSVIAFTTSKSFPKGYPLDKDEEYKIGVFNPHATQAWVATCVIIIRVRFWGIYL